MNNKRLTEQRAFDRVKVLAERYPTLRPYAYSLLDQGTSPTDVLALVEASVRNPRNGLIRRVA